MATLRAWLRDHRGFRRVFGAVVTLFAIALVLGTVAVAALHTDWGREQLRRRIETALDDSMRGKVTIGRLDGSPLTRLVAHDFSIAAEDGRPVIRADRVDIDFDAVALTGHTFRVSSVDIAGLEISARAQPGGGLDLTQALASPHPRDPRQPSTPSPWTIDLRRLSVADARVTVETAAGKVERFYDIDLRASGKLGPKGRSLKVQSASARWEREKLHLKVGELGVDGDRAIGANVVISQDGAVATIERFSTSVSGDDAFAILRVEATPHAIAERTRTPWLAGVNMRGVVRRTGSVWRGVLSGRIAGAPALIVGSADSSVPALSAWVSAQGVQPHQILATAPLGKLDLQLQVQLSELSADALAGEVRGTVSGTLAGNDLGTAVVDARIADRTLSAEIVARGGMLDGRVRARTGLDRNAPLSAHADIEAERLTLGNTRLTRVDATADIGGRLERPTGRVALAAGSITSGGRALGPGRATITLDGDRGRATFQLGKAGSRTFAARGDLRLARRGERVSAQVASLAVTARGTTWRGTGGRIDYERGQVSVDRLRVSSPVGAFEVTGRIDGERRGRLTLAGERIDLEEVDALLDLDLPAGLTGTATVSASLTLPAGPGRVVARFHDAGWTDRVQRVAGELAIDIERRRMTADLTVRTAQRSRARALLIATAPANLTDGRSWGRVIPGGVQSLHASIDKVSLATMQALVRRPIAATGTVSGSIRLGRGLERGEVRLAAQRIVTPRLPAPVSALIRATIDPERMSATAHVSLADQLLGRIELSTRRGLRQIAAQPALLTTTPVEAEAVAPRLPLAMLMRLAGSPTDVRGGVSARATFRGTLAQPHVEWSVSSRDLAVRDSAIGELAASGRLDLDRWTAKLRATQRAGGRLDVAAAGNTETLRSARLDLQAHKFELAVLEPALAPFDVRALGGRVDGQISIAGGSASGSLRVRDGRFRMLGTLRAIRRAAVNVTIAGKRAKVVADGRYGRGDFELDGQVWLDGLRPSVFRATAEVDHFTIPAGSMPADVSANFAVRGQMTDRLLSATIDVAKGEVELPDRGGRALHPMSPPEDVVFADAKKQKPKANRDDRVIRLRLLARKGVRVRGEPIDAVFTTDLTATRVRGQLSVVGTVRAHRGTMTLFDRRYDIRRGTFAFAGEMPPNPELDVRLERDFDGASVAIDVSGTARSPRVSLSSDPPTYDQTQLIGLVVTGSPAAGTGESASLEGAAAGAASALIGKQVSRALERTLPIDTVRLASAQGSESTFVLVGKWVNDEVFVAYRRSVIAEEENENSNQAVIEYHISRQWMVEGHYGDAGEGGADVLWTVRL